MSEEISEQGKSSISVHTENQIATITITHGELNLLDIGLVGELFSALTKLQQDDHVKVIVFQSGIDGFFLSHADFSGLEQTDLQQHYKKGEFPRYSQFLELLRKYPKVTIAKVAGRATGGGAEFAFALDMCFADEDLATFSQMEIILGILPGGGGNQYLARRTGRSRALEMCLTGRAYSATEAERYGAINRALPSGELDEYINRLTGLIVSHSHHSIERNKAAINLIEDRMSQDFVDNNDMFVDLAHDPEFRRRVRTFMSLGGGTAQGEESDWSYWAHTLASDHEGLSRQRPDQAHTRSGE